ncbi:MAG TPA: guanine deaminase [Deltaproteobacteria bacterium]|nr:guanine deaminase [Deltaproteobacteria bacterium]
MSAPDRAAPPNARRTALRGPMVWFVGSPFEQGDEALMYESDGLLIMEDGRFIERGPASALLPLWADRVTVTHHPHGLIVPGFVDTHLHLPQMAVMGSYGRQLLDWLTEYTFPNEARFHDPAVCADEASLFLDVLASHGVTTGSVFATVHPGSAQALFTQALRRNVRIVAGKVLMDRNSPEGLRDTAQQGYDDSQALIDAWHGKGRLRYSVTPRFAPTSTPAQLEAAGELVNQNPGVHIQSHLSENLDEVAWVRSLFPNASSYLDVYRRSGLLGRRAIYAHGIHLDSEEWALLSESETALAHCPTSNLFLGSGLFELDRAMSSSTPVRVGLASDIGGGTSLSPLQTMGEAYKVAQLRGHSVTAAQLWWLHTLGAAEALDMGSLVGNLAPGHEADAVVLDGAHIPLVAHRMAQVRSIHEQLFYFAACGDDRLVRETWIAGECAYNRSES